MNVLWVAISISIALVSVNAAAQNAKRIDPDKARVVEYWTKERRAKAIPRDLVIDPRGLGYLRRPDGTLVPYGHDVEAQTPPRKLTPTPFAKPGGSDDTTPPEVRNVDPGAGKVIGETYTFSATVTDASGVKSVTFKIQKVGATFVNSFSASKAADSDVWSAGPLQGFTAGDWSWWVEAKDNASRGGNTEISATVLFKVSTGGGGGGGGGGGTVTNAQWTTEGAIQTAAGRLYFEMPNNAKRKGPWTGYVCSGTVANDENTPGRSIIITAAHCVYDDVNNAFARNVIFIPNQAGTTGSGTDTNCGNDPIGCWVPSYGVVHKHWTTSTFPSNKAWDYAFYLVNDTGAHGPTPLFNTSSDALDVAAGSFSILFGAPSTSTEFEYALGYSYSDDPKFMYCAENMSPQAPGTNGSVNWWLPGCGLSGGSSGGPWVQPPANTAANTWGGNTGSIISVNSWGYTNSPGMAGPKLVGSSAQCVFGDAKVVPLPPTTPPDGDAGKAVNCP